MDGDDTPVQLVEGGSGLKDAGTWHAFLTSAYVCKTSEVETTSSIVEIFRKIVEAVPLEGHTDNIVAILAGARIRNVAGEAMLANLRSVFDSLKSFVSGGCGEKASEPVETKAALLSFGVIATAEKSISSKGTHEYFCQVLEALRERDISYVTTLLTMGRLLDIGHKDFLPVAEVMGILDSFEYQVSNKLDGCELNSNSAFGAGMVTATLADISKDIETTKDLVTSFQSICGKMSTLDRNGLVAYILMCGHIRDFDITHMFMAQSIETLVNKIRTKLEDGA